MTFLPKACLLPAVAISLTWSSMSAADELRVAVASNFAPVLETLAPVFEKESGHTVAIIAGATGAHYTQIINGAPYDMFLSADDERPGMLVKEGKAVDGTVFNYAIGQLVLWSSEANVVDQEGKVLQAGDFDHLAIANPKLAPYGEAAEEVLRGLGLWDGLQGKIVMGENITQTLQFIATGNAELGFIARSQWLETDAERKGSVWEIPANMHAPIIQQGVLLRDTPASQQLKIFLQSASAKAIIATAGYAAP